MRNTPGFTEPVQIFNPFDLGDLERQDIMGLGMVPIPALVKIPSTDVDDISGASVVLDINVKVSRKFARNTNQLFFWAATTDQSPPGSDNLIRGIGTFRTLMKF